MVLADAVLNGRRLRERVDDFCAKISVYLTASAPLMLRIALGIVFLWFGALKFFPGLSPAEELAGKTISVLTAGHIPPNIGVPLLAVWESTIGLGLLLLGPRRIFLAMLLLEMPGTLLPFVFFPHETFTHVPFVPTLEGQYIIKNLVLIAGACALLGSKSRRTNSRAVV